MKKTSLFFLFLLMASGSRSSLTQSPPQVTFAEAQARKVIAQNCVMCHDEDILTQQKLSQAAWLKALQKMQSWGSPIADSDVEPLSVYLAIHYSPDSPSALKVTKISAAQVQRAVMPEGATSGKISGDGKRGAELYGRHCAQCHGSQGRGQTAPNLLNPLLTRGTDWKAVLLNGRNLMPAWKGILNEQGMSDIHAWLLEEARKL